MGLNLRTFVLGIIVQGRGLKRIIEKKKKKQIEKKKKNKRVNEKRKKCKTPFSMCLKG